MDDTIEFVDTEGSVAQVQSQIRTSASKQSFSTQVDDSKKVEDNNCNLSIITSSTKLSPSGENEDKFSTVSQVSAHLKERLNLKSGSSINGIVNGIGVGVNLSHAAGTEHLSITNGKTSKSESSSLYDKYEINIGDENSVADHKSFSNCMKNIPEVSRKSSESVTYNEGSGSKVESRDNQEVKYVSYKSELQMPDIMRLIQKDLSEPYSIYTYRYFIHNWPKLCFLAMDGSECVGAIVCKLDVHRKVVKRGYIAMLAVDEKYRKRKIGSNLVLKAIRAMVADDADEIVCPCLYPSCAHLLDPQEVSSWYWETSKELASPQFQGPSRKCLNYICDLLHQFIKFPDVNETRRFYQEFYRIAQFPGVVGCTDDGTHVPIKNPGGEHPEVFRLGIFSFNCQVVLETEITNRPALRLYENLGFVRDKRLFRYYLNGVDALRLKLWLR